MADPGFRSLLDGLLDLNEGALAVLTAIFILTDPRRSVSGISIQVGDVQRCGGAWLQVFT